MEVAGVGTTAVIGAGTMADTAVTAGVTEVTNQFMPPASSSSSARSAARRGASSPCWTVSSVPLRTESPSAYDIARWIRVYTRRLQDSARYGEVRSTGHFRHSKDSPGSSHNLSFGSDQYRSHNLAQVARHSPQYQTEG